MMPTFKQVPTEQIWWFFTSLQVTLNTFTRATNWYIMYDGLLLITVYLLANFHFMQNSEQLE